MDEGEEALLGSFREDFLVVWEGSLWRLLLETSIIDFLFVVWAFSLITMLEVSTSEEVKSILAEKSPS
jgi:hypothetical protein